MKTIIAGGRDFKPLLKHYKFVWDLKPQITVIVSGCAKGADQFGLYLAKHWHLPFAEFPAQWDKHGKQAGIIRNGVMARFSDAVILFPGGRGTANMLNQAIEFNLKIYQYKEKITRGN